MLIVVVIVGILAAVVIPRFFVSTDEANKNACAQNVARINTLVERWHAEKGEWPETNLSDIGADPDYFPDGIPRRPVSGSKYTLDSATHRVSAHSH